MSFSACLPRSPGAADIDQALFACIKRPSRLPAPKPHLEEQHSGTSQHKARPGRISPQVWHSGSADGHSRMPGTWRHWLYTGPWGPRALGGLEGGVTKAMFSSQPKSRQSQAFATHQPPLAAPAHSTVRRAESSLGVAPCGCQNAPLSLQRGSISARLRCVQIPPSPQVPCKSL